MRLGIMQPYLFPHLAYFQLINLVDTYVIYDDVQFIKGGWINRNNILVNGTKTLITVPLNGASSNKNINEITIMNDDFDKILETIKMAYSQAPYYDNAIKVVESIFNYKDMRLNKFVGNSINHIIDYLGIGTNILYSSDLDNNKLLKAQDKVIDICKFLQADTYINASGGKDLYSVSEFKKNGIDLYFIKPGPLVYSQMNIDFVSGLSIIDVMMFNSKNDIKEMLKNYELI